MLHLRTFGGAAISADDGIPLDGAASQRRLLALLSALAVAGESGLTRDRLVGLLWPEGDPLRVRHALTQSLYQARRALQCNDLFDAGADIRLNPAHITSDVDELKGHLDRGDLSAAVDVYKGPFLDGFFLTGSTEFDQWVNATRDRYATRITVALEKLATGEEERGNWQAAAGWRRRVVELDPLSAAATTKLMVALANGGDRALAIHHANLHTALIRERLDLDPDESIQSLVAQLRRVSPPAPVTTAQVSRSSASQWALATPDSLKSVHRGSKPAAWIVRAGLVAAVALIGFLVVALIPRTTRQLESTELSADSRGPIVVAPFRTDGADPSLAYLREGLVELLSTRFVDDTLGRSVDPGAVLTAWHRVKDKSGVNDVSREASIRLGQQFHASRLVAGSVIGTPAHLVVTASLISLGSTHTEIDASVEGSADSLTVLVDRLAAHLLAESAGEHDRLAARLTQSLPALRAFLNGQQAYRSGNFQGAVEQFERAIAFDSTFGMAAFQLALVADHLNDAEQHDRALAIAWANRRDLTERDLTHLIAFAGPRYPAPSTKFEQMAAWNHAVEVAPDRAEVWYELGEHLYHDGGVVGVDSPRVRSAKAFARALELDPDDRAGARPLLILSAARARDTALLRRFADPSVVRGMHDPFATFVRWRLAIATGDSDVARRIQDGLSTLDNGNLRLIAMASLQDGVDVPTGLRAVSIWSARHENIGSLDPLLAQHAFALNQGRSAAALAITGRIHDLQPGLRSDLRLRVLDAIYSEGDTTAANAAAAELETATRVSPVGDLARGLQLADLCVLEQWRLQHGRTEKTQTTIDRLRTAALPRTQIPVAANQRTCAMMLDAWLAVETHSSGAERQVAALDSVTLSGPAVSDAANYSHILLSRLYDRLGHPDKAFGAIRRRHYMTGWPRYLSTAEREHSRLAMLAGEKSQARDVRERYLALRVPVPAVATTPVRGHSIFGHKIKGWW